MDNYQVIKSETKFQGSKLKVDIDTIVTPENITVQWDRLILGKFITAIPVTTDNQVIMVREWRQGPRCKLTQFTGARESKAHSLDFELAKELEEEIGITYFKRKLILDNILLGPHFSGSRCFELIYDFKINQPKQQANELITIVYLPLQNLFANLRQNHFVTAECLLIAKIIQNQSTLELIKADF